VAGLDAVAAAARAGVTPHTAQVRPLVDAVGRAVAASSRTACS